MNNSVYKVVELVGSSAESWEFAAQYAVREAAAPNPNLRIVEFVEMDVLIEAGTVPARSRGLAARNVRAAQVARPRVGDGWW